MFLSHHSLKILRKDGVLKDVTECNGWASVAGLGYDAPARQYRQQGLLADLLDARRARNC
jgi:hypothetical protein